MNILKILVSIVCSDEYNKISTGVTILEIVFVCVNLSCNNAILEISFQIATETCLSGILLKYSRLKFSFVYHRS